MAKKKPSAVKYEPCHACRGQRLPGILMPIAHSSREEPRDGLVFVDKCDECDLYESAEAAAAAVSELTGWTVKKSLDETDALDAADRKAAKGKGYFWPYFEVTIEQAVKFISPDTVFMDLRKPTPVKEGPEVSIAHTRTFYETVKLPAYCPECGEKVEGYSTLESGVSRIHYNAAHEITDLDEASLENADVILVDCYSCGHTLAEGTSTISNSMAALYAASTNPHDKG